jgi:hypothetical protein
MAFKSRKPRFSLRTLIILTTLVCIYLGCWFPTATQGVSDVQKRINSEAEATRKLPMPRAPLFLETTRTRLLLMTPSPITSTTSTYYVWFFGWVAKLPFTTTRAGTLADDADEIGF